MLAWLASIRKAIAAIVGGAVTVLTLVNVIPLPAQWHATVGTLLVIATGIATWAVPNKTTATTTTGATA